MKIKEIISEAHGELGTRLSQQELDFIFQIIEDSGVLDVTEISEIVEQHLPDYVRNKNSLRMAAVRAHILVHGQIPLNMEPNVTWFSRIPEEMQMVAIERGHDPFEAVEAAKADVKERQKHVKEPAAINMMSKEYMGNKNKYKPSIKQHRNEIVQNIMKGATAQQAMMAFMT